MTFDEAISAIEQLWLDEWVDDSDDERTPSVFDEEPSQLMTGDVPWCRVSIRHTGGTQATAGATGGRNFDRLGSVFVQVYTLTGAGRDNDDESLSSSKLAQAARAVFEAKRVEGTSLVFFTGDPREGATDGRWAMTTVEVPFRYRETK